MVCVILCLVKSSYKNNIVDVGTSAFPLLFVLQVGCQGPGMRLGFSSQEREHVQTYLHLGHE